MRRTQGTQITKFTYDGLDVVMDDVNGTLTKYQNGPGIDNKLKMATGNTPSYFLTDHLGSTNALTNSTGAITSSATYDSFGNQTGNLATRYSYTGREFDNFSGLYFYRARWYSADIGRFISEDPIGFEGGVNWFAYAGNSPVRYSDPTGLDYAVFENGQLTWVYEKQPEGWFRWFKSAEETGRKSWGAVSGCDESCPNPKKKEPVPPGTYYTEPGDREDKSDKPGDWGPLKFGYRLHAAFPSDWRNYFYYGRSGGFFIHGGNIRGSAGCIEMAQYVYPEGEPNWLSEFDYEMTRFGQPLYVYVR